MYNTQYTLLLNQHNGDDAPPDSKQIPDIWNPASDKLFLKLFLLAGDAIAEGQTPCFYFLNSYEKKKRSFLRIFALLCQVQDCNYKFNNELITKKGEISGNAVFPVFFDIFLSLLLQNHLKFCIPHT